MNFHWVTQFSATEVALTLFMLFLLPKNELSYLWKTLQSADSVGGICEKEK